MLFFSALNRGVDFVKLDHLNTALFETDSAKVFQFYE